MKISDIVKVNITEAVTTSPTISEMNSIGAIIYISPLAEQGTTDATWIASSSLGTDYNGETEINRAIDTYTKNGGVSLVVKRLYFATGDTSSEIIDEITKSIYGGTGVTETDHEILSDDVKNIQLVWKNDSQPAIDFSTLAQNFVKNDTPEQTKILFITSKISPTSLSTTPNIFYHYIGSSSVTNYFESIAAMAYLSKINYSFDTIKDYEYTIWGNGSTGVNLIESLPSGVESQGKVSFFSPTAGLNVLIGGFMTNGIRLISYYFGLILSHRISNLLTLMTIEKLNFSQSTYGYIYNRITIELDKFTKNGLLDSTFVVDADQYVIRDYIRYKLVSKDQPLAYGYAVNTLPPTALDKINRSYTGLYILYAIDNQIRTMEVQGIVLGGLE